MPPDKPDNPVQSTASTLGITQKELAERIGAAEATVRNWSAGKVIPQWAIKSMELLIENEKNKEIVTAVKHLQTLLKEI